MVFATKTYNTTTFAGLLECVADTLGMPAGNLEISLDSTRRQVTALNLLIASELQQRDLPDEVRAQRLQQLQTANRALQLLDEAFDQLRAAQQLGASLLPPKPEDELPPGPPIVRQRGEGPPFPPK